MNQLNALEIQESDRLLIEDCVSGKRDAQYQLYKKYNKAMFNICCRMINDVGDAEDVLQNSFVDIFQKLKMFKHESTPGAWIKRIVVNNCINHLRRKKLEFKELDERVQVSDGSDVEDVNFDVRVIKKAIENLPDGYRIVFSLYAMEGYDHGEIAEILNISESTSKSQYSRARSKIYEDLKSSGSMDRLYH